MPGLDITNLNSSECSVHGNNCQSNLTFAIGIRKLEKMMRCMLVTIHCNICRASITVEWPWS